MQTVKDTKTNKGLYATVALFLFTAIILALLFLNIEKKEVIDLNTADISVIDDRAVFGASIAKFIKTNQGVEFSCQIAKSHLEQPYCELLIDVENLSKQASLTGLDLTKYESIGLWIKHNHPTQPGTRIELRNFNDNYSVKDDGKSLKPNSFEYLEAYVSDPIWLKLNDFSIPQWWNISHNLTLAHGGTDFSNIHSIAIAPGTKVQEGNYKLTIERIEVKGKYVAPTTLISGLIAIWCFALGYLINRTKPTEQANTETPSVTKQTISFGAMSCPLTGALNRIGLRKCFDQLAPTDLQHLSIIFLNIDYFSEIQSNNGQQIADEVLQQFVVEVNKTCRSSDTVARWNAEEFLLVCRDTELDQAVDVADKIRLAIQSTDWPSELKITCSSGVAQMFDEDLNDLIARANKALYKAKNSGSNRTAAA